MQAPTTPELPTNEEILRSIYGASSDLQNLAAVLAAVSAYTVDTFTKVKTQMDIQKGTLPADSKKGIEEQVSLVQSNVEIAVISLNTLAQATVGALVPDNIGGGS